MQQKEHGHKKSHASQDEKNTGNFNEESFEEVNLDENDAASAPVNETEAPEESKVARLENELQEQKDKYLRLVAEFDNYRKRISRERLELMQTAGKDVIISLLDVLDDCDRATEQMENTDDINIVKEGVLLIFNKLRSQLQARGLKEMESLHADFDAELHDAITEIPAPSKDLVGKVIDNIQKGYYLNDKLIRHAKVVVGK